MPRYKVPRLARSWYVLKVLRHSSNKKYEVYKRRKIEEKLSDIGPKCVQDLYKIIYILYFLIKKHTTADKRTEQSERNWQKASTCHE